MPLIRCTQKLQKEMGLKKSDLQDSSPGKERLESWHANLIYIDRKKCVLFCNDKTLFNFLVPGVVRQQVRDLGQLFQEGLERTLAGEIFAERTKEEILKEIAGFSYGKTDNRRVLGSMNDLAFHYEFLILRDGGIHFAPIPEIIKQLNRMPMGALDYAYPNDTLLSVFQDA